MSASLHYPFGRVIFYNNLVSYAAVFGSSHNAPLHRKLHVITCGDYMWRTGPVSRDLGTSVKHIKNQLCDYVEKSQPG